MVPGAGRVDEQRLEVRRLGRVRIDDRRVEEPRGPRGVVEHLGAVVEAGLELVPDLFGDLLTRAVAGELAFGRELARGGPVGDVDRKDSADGAVAHVVRVEPGPELPL